MESQLSMSTAPTPPKPTSYYVLRAVQYTFLIVLVAVMMGPVLTAFLGSIRTTGEFLARPFDIPRGGIQWEHYTEILKSGDFWNSLKNSLIITIGVTSVDIVLASMLAFVFSHLSFRGRGLVFNILSIGLMFPLVVAILPVFIQLRQIGLLDSFVGLILTLAAFGLPGSVIILRGFFRAIPSELEDAAYIDGCNTLMFFRYVVIPLSRPALAAVATLHVIASWNEFFLPLVVLSDPKKWPLPLGIMQYQGQFGTDWARVMAYVCILIVPAIVFFLFTEKYIVTGLTGGELKG